MLRTPSRGPNRGGSALRSHGGFIRAGRSRLEMSIADAVVMHKDELAFACEPSVHGL